MRNRSDVCHGGPFQYHSEEIAEGQPFHGFLCHQRYLLQNLFPCFQGQGSQPLISYNYGAGNAQRVRKTYKLLLITSLSYSMAIWAAIMVMPRVFAGIFTPDQQLLEFTAKALRIYCGGLGIFGIQVACQMAFVSLGNALCSVTVAVMRKIVLLLPLIYLMPRLMADKTMAVYTAEPVADVLAVTFTAILFFFVFRKAMKKLEDKKPAE